jgi:quercetin dioxygenase-like cupin family protein
MPGMHEAKIENTETGRQPADDGWFILNLAEMGWETAPGGGTWSVFESPAAPSSMLGIGVHILAPGESPGYYHAESEQEGFLVLSGECIAVVEGQERRLRAWDYLHCPPHPQHFPVGAPRCQPRPTRPPRPTPIGRRSPACARRGR